MPNKEKQWDFGASVNSFEHQNPILTDLAKERLSYSVSDLRGESSWAEVERTPRLDWTYRGSLSWNDTTTDQTISDLPVADWYLVMIWARSDTTIANQVGIRLNGVSAASSYHHRYIVGTTITNDTTVGYCGLFEFQAQNESVAFPIYIQGKASGTNKSISLISPAYLHATSRQFLGGVADNDSNDLRSITLITASAASWTGRADFYSYEFRQL